MPPYVRAVVETATDENEIIRRCQAGNYEAFGQLYDAYVKPVYSFIYYRTHHKETAEDITSAVFSKALAGLPGFKLEKAKFSTWLYQIARNTIIDHYRAQRGTEDLETAWDVASNTDIPRDTDTAMKLEQAKAALQKLPKQQRDIVVMRVWDGLSHQEIAAVLGISEASAKMGFSRAVARINKDMPALLLVAALMSLK